MAGGLLSTWQLGNLNEYLCHKEYLWRRRRRGRRKKREAEEEGDEVDDEEDE